MANPKGPATGRQSIFRDKIGGDRVQGVITPAGSRRFELARFSDSEILLSNMAPLGIDFSQKIWVIIQDQLNLSGPGQRQQELQHNPENRGQSHRDFG